MKIAIFGTGYVGLVTGACFADVGHQVICVDIDEAKIEGLKKGVIPIYEPGLDVMVKKNFSEGRLNFTTDARQAISFGELLFIAVGTPPDEDGSSDISYVLQVARTIGEHIDEYKVIIDKSTVPVGTADKVHDEITSVLSERGSKHTFDVCSNPEFLKEGSAIEDFTKGARIIIGANSDKVFELMRECYLPYNRNHEKMMFMDIRSAELTKYAANAMLATKISFMNELSHMAEHLGADIEHVRQGIGSDPRIGFHFIYPGCGYGGSCFPKDVKALAKTGSQIGCETDLLDAVERVNNRQKHVLFNKLEKVFDGNLSGKTIAVWGLAFKPNTDDMREAPSRVLIEALWSAGAKVKAYDPVAGHEAARIYGERDDLELLNAPYDVLIDADALVICTEWKEFRSFNFESVKESMNRPVIVDGRNMYAPERIEKLGFEYYAIGRGR